ncbi:hypothetical protein FGO68_gene15248 [Halteria grandinella]|uniref:Uncharacterized protein n=1 Tax=Halteria grandinella TaxID=5974 RepID=A0A8J8SZ00_HALGN|nr:hypothetical protein FGO68_gene15248 [Halteria grandinella]
MIKLGPQFSSPLTSNWKEVTCSGTITLQSHTSTLRQLSMWIPRETERKSLLMRPWDCTGGLLTQKIPAIEFCTQLPLGQTYNLTELLKNARDPASGVSTYKGMTALPWTGGFQLHWFVMRAVDAQGKEIIENLYFCPKSLNFKYLIIEGAPEIFYSENGFVEMEFTDADFAPWESCSSVNEDDGRQIETLVGLRF